MTTPDLDFKLKMLSQINEHLDELVTWNHLGYEASRKHFTALCVEVFTTERDLNAKTEESKSERRQVREGVS